MHIVALSKVKKGPINFLDTLNARVSYFIVWKAGFGRRCRFVLHTCGQL